MIILKRGKDGLSYLAGNNHEGSSLELALPLEMAEHQAKLVIPLYAPRASYRLLLTDDDIRRIIIEAKRHGVTPRRRARRSRRLFDC